MSYVPCRWGCGTYVMFLDTVLSKSGKKIPIQENGLNHDCHLSPYYRSKSNNTRAVAAAKKPLRNIEEYQLVQDARTYIVNLNSRLGLYELSLIVKEKTQNEFGFEEPTAGLRSLEALGE